MVKLYSVTVAQTGGKGRGKACYVAARVRQSSIYVRTMCALLDYAACSADAAHTVATLVADDVETDGASTRAVNGMTVSVAVMDSDR